MIAKRLQIFLLSVVLLAGSGAVVLAHLDNLRLRKRVAGLRGQSAEAARLQEANQRTRRLLERVAADEADGAQEIQATLTQVRTRVGELERRALETRRRMRAAAEADAISLDRNHDPEKGLARLENFQNVGQATPAAAFQTFVWAALKGENGEIAGMIAFEGDAREKAAAALVALPEPARALYPSPETLAALFFAAALNGRPAAEIVNVVFPDSQHATVSVRGLTDNMQRVPMQLGAQGWQIVVPAGLADKLGGWAQAQPIPPKP